MLVREGKKTEAALVLTNLQKLSTLTQADKDFLTKQIAICQGKDTKQTQNPSTTNATPRPSDPSDANCGARALTLAARELGVKSDVTTLTKAAHTDGNGANLEGLEAAARSIGLKSESVQVDKDALESLQTPAIAWWEGNHYVVLLKVDKNTFTGTTSATIHDPNNTEAISMPLNDVLAKSGGIFLTLKR
jgi:ABC-type bacteriocin/lantibiotic exporter with double-glycine peptidase domain